MTSGGARADASYLTNLSRLGQLAVKGAVVTTRLIITFQGMFVDDGTYNENLDVDGAEKRLLNVVDLKQT